MLHTRKDTVRLRCPLPFRSVLDLGREAERAADLPRKPSAGSNQVVQVARFLRVTRLTDLGRSRRGAFR